MAYLIWHHAHYNILVFIQNVTVTIEGNSLATDGSIRFTIEINEGNGFLLGGVVDEIQHYTSVEVTIMEDDSKLMYPISTVVYT